jgi:uncharacterized protein YaaQ
MKLMLLIVHNDDASEATAALIKAGNRVTRLPSTGGLLGEGNTTLICGLEDGKVDEAVSAVSEVCRSRVVDLQRGHPLFANIRSVHVGGAVGFVLDVERWFRL